VKTKPSAAARTIPVFRRYYAGARHALAQARMSFDVAAQSSGPAQARALSVACGELVCAAELRESARRWRAGR
jgi:hypothetical protein